MDGLQRVALINVSDSKLAAKTGQGLGRLGYKVILTTGTEKSATDLRDQGLDTHFLRLDLSNRQAIGDIVCSLAEELGRIDALVADAQAQDNGIQGVSVLCSGVIRIMRDQGYGRVALLANAAPAKNFVNEANDTNIKINTICPSQDCVDKLIWLITLPDDGPSGNHYRSQPSADD